MAQAVNDGAMLTRIAMHKIPAWLRWPLTPLASAVTLVAALVVGNLLAKVLVFLGPQGWSENFLQYLVVPWLAAFLAVRIVEPVAPKAKRRSAIVIAGIWLAIAGAYTFDALITSQWRNLLFALAFVVGAVYGTSEIREESPAD